MTVEPTTNVGVRLEPAGLDLVRQLCQLPRWPPNVSATRRLGLIEQEAILRDRLANYVYAYDAGDLAAVMTFFSDDCVLVNPRGSYVGRAAIEANYEQMLKRWPMKRHFWTNVTVRFPDSTAEAYVTAYHHAVLTAGNETLSIVGNDAQRWSKRDDAWLIVERAIAVDVTQDLSLLR